MICNHILGTTHHGSYKKVIDVPFEKHELKEAFECAHALKGVLANLALTNLLEPVSELTELFRNGEEKDYGIYLDRMDAERAKLLAARD